MEVRCQHTSGVSDLIQRRRETVSLLSLSVKCDSHVFSRNALRLLLAIDNIDGGCK